jgi:hypothetical protein
MTTQVTPLHQFKLSVAERLQKPPYNWVGSAGFELARKYDRQIEMSWDMGETVDVVADMAHKCHMRVKPKYNRPTRASLEAAGCVFVKR